MARLARGSVRALLAALLASTLLALLVSPARGRGGRDHGDWDEASLLPPLPPREDAARVARFVTHVSDWGALATISTLEAVRGRPFADVLSLSDGPPGAGSGVPYFYLSPLQLSVNNLQVSWGPRLPQAGCGRGGHRASLHLGPNSSREVERGSNVCRFSAALAGGRCSVSGVGQLGTRNFAHAPATGPSTWGINSLPAARGLLIPEWS